MSGGKEKAKTNQMLDTQYAQNQAFNQGQQALQGGRANTAYGQNQQSYNDIMQGYKNFAMGNFDPGGSGGFIPNYNTGMYGDVQNAYRNSMGASGGLDPNRVATMDKTLAGMGAIGNLGAADATSAARLRGGGLYDELVKTGGLSESDRYNIRNQAARTNQSLYGGITDNLARMSRIQGGGGPGYAAAASRLARQGAQGATETVRGANQDIASQVLQGRLAGAQGMSSTENQIVQNQLAGLGGAFAGNQGLAESIRSGQQWGTEGLGSLADKQAAAQQASAAAAANASRYRNSMMMAGLGGMMDLRGQNVGSEQGYTGNVYNAQAGTNAATSNIIGQRMQNNPQHSWLDYLSAGAGAAGAAMTGMGSMGARW